MKLIENILFISLALTLFAVGLLLYFVHAPSWFYLPYGVVVVIYNFVVVFVIHRDRSKK